MKHWSIKLKEENESLKEKVRRLEEKVSLYNFEINELKARVEKDKGFFSRIFNL